MPVLLPPEEVEVDVYTCTHNHQDHTDPETIRRLRHKDTAQFVGPAFVLRLSRTGNRGGARHARVAGLRDGSRDVSVHGTFALPTDATDLNHMGYVFRFGDGPAVHVTGDTDYSELLFACCKA